jgi:erythromycin esterase
MEVNKFGLGKRQSQDTKEILRNNFTRWPTWMWSNENMEEFIDWLRKHNESLKDEEKCGFYGFDVYSLFESQ